MSKAYDVQVEVAGPTAMWSRPDTGGCQVSYPAPTFGGLKGVLENILFLKHAEVLPTMVEICAPVRYYPYKFNYCGPLRSSKNMKRSAAEQFRQMVLIDVRYKIHAIAKAIGPHTGNNSGHAYQDMFNARLARQAFWHHPFLGLKEFVASYVGPFRSETKACEEVNEKIDGMLLTVFPYGHDSAMRPVFYNATIRKGILVYPSHPDYQAIQKEASND